MVPFCYEKVALANVDAKAETGGVTSLYFSKCWRCVGGFVFFEVSATTLRLRDERS